jgi:hypothetical protein
MLIFVWLIELLSATKWYKISTKKPRPRILLPEDTGRNRGLGRYLVYFDFKNYKMYEN